MGAEVIIESFESFSFILFLLYTLMALIAIFQIFRIIIYCHRKLSFQFAFLVFCFIWGIIRAIYFLFISAEWANWVSFLLHWIPLIIQFSTFSLLVIFYMKQVYRSTWEETTWAKCAGGYLIANAAFILYLTIYSGLVYRYGDSGAYLGASGFTWLGALGQGLSSLIFLALVLILGYYGYRVFKLLNESKIAAPFQVKGTSNKLVLYSTLIIVIIFISRSLYDFITVFGVLLVPVDAGLTGTQFIMFILYFVWEITPAYLVLFLFWRIPSRNQKKIIPRQSTPLSMQHRYVPPDPINTRQIFEQHDSDSESSTLSSNGPTPPLYGLHTAYSITPSHQSDSE